MSNTKGFFEEKKGWSLIKDMIINDYLSPYIAKILFTRKPLIIVDCFAGKGKFNDGADGSPLIIAKHIKNVLENQNVNAYPNKEICACFIEKKYSKDLKDNIKDYKNCKVYKGTYEKYIEKLLKSDTVNKCNVFLYIDPYGIKNLDFDYFKQIKEKNFPSVEILMNFNSFGFLREACRVLKYEKILREDDEMPEDESIGIVKLDQIAGGSYWQGIVKDKYDGKIDMKQAEDLFMQEYSNKISNIFKYTINIPIKEKSENMPKYRMLFASNHDDALLLMADRMHKAWKNFEEQEKTKDPQTSLYELYDFPDMKKIKGYNPEEDIKLFLPSKGKMNLKNLYIKMILKYGISYSITDYKEILQNLEKTNLIEVQRVPEKTNNGKMSKSWNYDKHKITIGLKQ